MIIEVGFNLHLSFPTSLYQEILIWKKTSFVNYFKLQEEHFVGVGLQVEHGLDDFSPVGFDEKKVDIILCSSFEPQNLHSISSFENTNISNLLLQFIHMYSYIGITFLLIYLLISVLFFVSIPLLILNVLQVQVFLLKVVFFS